MSVSFGIKTEIRRKKETKETFFLQHPRIDKGLSFNFTTRPKLFFVFVLRLSFSSNSSEKNQLNWKIIEGPQVGKL
jgi:hypothetical protein